MSSEFGSDHNTFPSKRDGSPDAMNTLRTLEKGVTFPEYYERVAAIIRPNKDITPLQFIRLCASYNNLKNQKNSEFFISMLMHYADQVGWKSKKKLLWEEIKFLTRDLKDIHGNEIYAEFDSSFALHSFNASKMATILWRELQYCKICFCGLSSEDSEKFSSILLCDYVQSDNTYCVFAAHRICVPQKYFRKPDSYYCPKHALPTKANSKKVSDAKSKEGGTLASLKLKKKAPIYNENNIKNELLSLKRVSDSNGLPSSPTHLQNYWKELIFGSSESNGNSAALEVVTEDLFKSISEKGIEVYIGEFPSFLAIKTDIRYQCKCVMCIEKCKDNTFNDRNEYMDHLRSVAKNMGFPAFLQKRLEGHNCCLSISLLVSIAL
jgi:hypothetical protein